MYQRRRQVVTHIKANTSKRLRTNLRMLFIVYFVLLVITIVRAVESHVSFWQVMSGFLWAS